MLYVVFIGVLMGLANLIPGVSGGTIALLGGLYERFVGSISSVSAFKIRKEDVVFLIEIVAGIVIGILGFSTLIDVSLSRVPSLMYGIFSGLVIGGTP
ncbi:undecaprenyl phosphate translocase family protein, partial [Mesotoga prima]